MLPDYGSEDTRNRGQTERGRERTRHMYRWYARIRRVPIPGDDNVTLINSEEGTAFDWRKGKKSNTYAVSKMIEGKMDPRRTYSLVGMLSGPRGGV